MNRKVKSIIAATLLLIAFSCVYVPYELSGTPPKLGFKIQVSKGYHFLWMPPSVPFTYGDEKDIPNDAVINHGRLILQILAIIALGAASVLVAWGKKDGQEKHSPPNTDAIEGTGLFPNQSRPPAQTTLN